ncbi:MAG TPA: YihY/virulence factor BrkB family protein [Acidisarcina sp.]
MWVIIGHFRRALWKSISHDTFTLAKAAAYSAILSLFPALLVTTTLLAISPRTAGLRREVRGAFDQVLPPDTMSLVQGYFQDRHALTVKIVWSASVLSLLAAMGVMLSLLEGFRRAYELPRHLWGFWMTRWIALLLIPICLVPLALATLLIAFGRQIQLWMVSRADHELQSYVTIAWRMGRWAVALLTLMTVLATIYHFGTPRTQHWRRVLPGAVLAAFTWFLATLLYGGSVTRSAQYTAVYGSLAAGVATLVWLYLTSLSVLIGAEFNAQIFPKDEIAIRTEKEWDPAYE